VFGNEHFSKSYPLLAFVLLLLLVYHPGVLFAAQEDQATSNEPLPPTGGMGLVNPVQGSTTFSFGVPAPDRTAILESTVISEPLLPIRTDEELEEELPLPTEITPREEVTTPVDKELKEERLPPPPKITARAQAAKSKVSPLHSVTVIGTRLPSFQVPFADVPANISYIPANSTRKEREQIYDTQPSMFMTSIKDIEGAIFYDEVGNTVDTTFGLRGFTRSSAIIFLLDGVRVNEVDGDDVVLPLIDMSDMEAIQIDRGSSSAIFGSNAFAGVVHLTSGRASDKPLSTFGGWEYSSFAGIRFHSGLSGTLPDKLTGLGGALTYYFKGGNNSNDGIRSNSDYHLTNFDIKTGYELPEEQGRVYFGLKHTEGHVSNPGALTFDQFQANDKLVLKDIDGRDRNNTIIQLGADKKLLEDHIIVSMLASQRYNKTAFNTTFATFSVFGEPTPDTDRVTKKSRTTDLIWQTAYKDDWGKLSNMTTLGMEMRNADEAGTNQDAPGGEVSNTLAINVDRFATPRSAGLFWRESLNFDNVIITHVGMRHDWHSLKIRDNLTPANNQDTRWNKSTVSTGVTIKPIESADFFFNYSQGFRVPTISELSSISSFGTSVSIELSPVKSDSYEVGTRIRVKDKAQLKGSFFLIDLKDEIVFDGNSRTVLSPFGQNTNVGKTRRLGLESRIDARPIDEVSIYGSYSWTKAYVRETDPAQPFSGVPSLADDRSFGLVPEHRITTGITIQPLKRLGDQFEGFEVGIHGVWTGKQHPASFESAAQATLSATGGAGHYIKSYSVWDFIVSHEWRGQEVYLKMNNVFNNKYYSRAVNATSFGSGLLPAGTFNFVNQGAPREILFGARWEIDSLKDLLSKPATA